MEGVVESGLDVEITLSDFGDDDDVEVVTSTPNPPSSACGESVSSASCTTKASDAPGKGMI